MTISTSFITKLCGALSTTSNTTEDNASMRIIGKIIEENPMSIIMSQYHVRHGNQMTSSQSMRMVAQTSMIAISVMGGRSSNITLKTIACGPALLATSVKKVELVRTFTIPKKRGRSFVKYFFIINFIIHIYLK